MSRRGIETVAVNEREAHKLRGQCVILRDEVSVCRFYRAGSTNSLLA